MTDLVSDSVWPGLAGWTVLYVSDYVLTLKGARSYRENAKEKLAHEGSYEITPYFQKDIDGLRSLSPRFFVALAWGELLLLAVWWASRRMRLEEVYAFALGAFIVPQAAVHVRHVVNLFLFRAARDDNSIRGRIEYSRALTLWISAIELFAFAGVFAVLFAFTQSVFVLGGSVRCLFSALEHRDRQRTMRNAAKQAEAATSGGLTAESGQGPRADR